MSGQGAHTATAAPDRRRRGRRMVDRRDPSRAEELANRYRDQLELVVSRHQAESTAAQEQLRVETLRRKRAEIHRERTLALLQDALDRAKTLQRLLPICGRCKKLRDDPQYRQQIARYFVARHGADNGDLSMCPDCAGQTDRRHIRLVHVTPPPEGDPSFSPARRVAAKPETVSA